MPVIHAPRLDAVLAGTAEPEDASDAIVLASIASHRSCHGASAGLNRYAFDLNEGLTEEHRYDAACQAARK